MRPIRVCYLITELELSGAERLVYELARRLDRCRFDVQVAALRGGAVADMLRQAGVPVTVLDVRGKWDVLKLRRLVAVLKGESGGAGAVGDVGPSAAGGLCGPVDILHTHLFHADLVGRAAAFLAGTRHVVHTVHVAEQRWRPWQFAFANLADWSCDRTVAVSRSVRDHHAARSHLPHDRYVVIPNGIDVAAYVRDDGKRAATRKAWCLADDELAALFVGRLDYQKGIDTLLAAIANAHECDVPLRWIIAGDGPMRGDVERFIASPAGTHCRYVGFAKDVQAALSAADMFVLPSRWEGFPLALAEAMACPLPCVATNVPGNRDAIESEVDGLLVPNENVAAVVEAVTRLAGDADLRRTLADAGGRKIAMHHSIEANVAAYERLYLDIAGGREILLHR